MKRSKVLFLASFGILVFVILTFIIILFVQWSSDNLQSASSSHLTNGLLQQQVLCIHSKDCMRRNGIATANNNDNNNNNKNNNSANLAYLTNIRSLTLSGLVESKQFISQGIKLKWIGIRIMRLSEGWEQTRNELIKELPKLFQASKNILIFPGLLCSEFSSYDFAGNAFKGGYLGELTQWSDLIAILHLFGHKLSFATSYGQLKHFLLRDTFDLIFTDYLGMNGIHRTGLLGLVKCKIRVLDSFGTEPVFGFQTSSFLADKEGKDFAAWTFENMKQLWTLYPHTPDNSFLGFAFVPPKTSIPHSQRKNQAIIYGKEAHYFYNKGFYLNTLASEVQLHSTVNTDYMPPGVPDTVIKHGFLSLKDLTNLLQESRVMIGLGAPYEGPGALEALANGCSFIQPKFNPPQNKYNEEYFRGKPTERLYTSQVPYLEHFVGEPYVYTVDITNKKEILSAVRKALKFTNYSSFLPHEFTQKGMMERIGSYISHQNFCDPPGMKIIEATASSSSDGSVPVKAIDDIPSESSCYKSRRSAESHWWRGDLGKETNVGRVKITLGYDWVWARESHICSHPYRISLLNGKGNTLIHRDYNDCRLVYDWTGLLVSGVRYVKIETPKRESKKKKYQLVLCSVNVFPYRSTHLPNWPHWTALQTVIGRPNQSCRDACIEKKMICEPNFYTIINKRTSVMNHLGCSVIHFLKNEYVHYSPAIAISNDRQLSIQAGHCIISDVSNLIGCAGQSNKYQRLCPCRHYTKGQITVPELHSSL